MFGLDNWFVIKMRMKSYAEMKAPPAKRALHQAKSYVIKYAWVRRFSVGGPLGWEKSFK